VRRNFNDKNVSRHAFAICSRHCSRRRTDLESTRSPIPSLFCYIRFVNITLADSLPRVFLVTEKIVINASDKESRTISSGTSRVQLVFGSSRFSRGRTRRRNILYDYTSNGGRSFLGDVCRLCRRTRQSDESDRFSDAEPETSRELLARTHLVCLFYERALSPSNGSPDQ